MKTIMLILMTLFAIRKNYGNTLAMNLDDNNMKVVKQFMTLCLAGKHWRVSYCPS